MFDEPKCVIALSGGLDSAVLLAHCIKKHKKVLAVGFYYGQKHGSYELKCARALCGYYNVEFLHIDLTSITKHLVSNLLDGGGDIPEGHYTDEGMKATTVPGRNTIFMSILIGIAQSRGASIIGAGIQGGEVSIYPDSRPAFYEAMSEVAKMVSENTLEFEAPFVTLDKLAILDIAEKLNVPLEYTRTCYKDQELSCGKCGACTKRLEAFADFGTIDPIKYDKGIIE